MVIIRLILVGLIIWLIFRSFMRFGEGEKSSSHGSGPENKSTAGSKGVSKKIGEYIDYEEVDKQRN
jgi:hypothetical protein